MILKSKDEKAQRRSIGARQNPATESAILDAALDLLLTKGPKGLTMDAVARKAKAGKATIYRWWPTHGALLLAIYGRIKGPHAHVDTGRFETDVAAFFDYVFAFWQGHAGRVFSQVIAQAQGDADVAAALHEYRQARIQDWSVVIERAVARGELADNIVPEQISEAIIALAWHHLLINRLDAKGADLAHLVVSGVLKR